MNVTRKKVSFDTQPSGATVYVDDEKVGTTPVKVGLSRAPHEVRIEKEGYRDHSQLIEADRFGVSIGYIKPVPDKLSVDLVKYPPSVEGSAFIACDQVRVSLRAGDKLGNIFISHKPLNPKPMDKMNPGEIIYFDETVDLNADRLVSSANLALEDLGFDVYGSRQGVFSVSSSANYYLRGKIDDIKANVYRIKHYPSTTPIFASRIHERRIVKVEVITQWELLDERGNLVVKGEGLGKATQKEDQGFTGINVAFENSLYDFINQHEASFYKALEKKVGAQVAGAPDALPEQKLQEAVTIRQPADEGNPTSLEKAVEGVVTLIVDEGHGSGCIISSDGYIVTNNHVINDSEDKITVKTSKGETYRAKLVARNMKYDVALLKVETLNEVEFEPMSFDQALPGLGEEVYGIGTAVDISLGQTLSKGIVSGKRQFEDLKLIQSDASINAGCSGGALVNEEGVLIGILNSKVAGLGVEGLSFAIPMAVVVEALDLTLE